MRKYRGIRYLAGLGVLASLFASYARAGDFSVKTIDTGLPVKISSLATGQQIAVEGLDGSRKIAGNDVNFKNFSGVMGISSQAYYILVADGNASVDGQKAEAGNIILFLPYEAQPSVQRYDADRFLDSWTDRMRNQNAGLAALFVKVGQAQNLGKFFGRFETTAFNVAVPDSASRELGRRSIVGNNSVRKIRFSSASNPVEIEKRVVKSFVQGLSKGDARAVADLLDPSPFGRSDLRGGGGVARLLMAEQLLASQDWTSRFENARFSKSKGGVWQVTAAGYRTEIMLKPVGDFTFIQSIYTGE